MHVISRKRLRDFSSLHGDAEAPLRAWYQVMSKTEFGTFGELRKAFAAADKIGPLTVFNIGGNKYRLIAAIHYNSRRVYIRHVLTHADYDRGWWKR